jgi:hypothetical protein
MTIIVNGIEYRLIGAVPGEEELSYEIVVALAGWAPSRIVSVTYKDDDSYRHGVIVSPGTTVVLDEGAVFNVADTSGA